MSDIQNKMVELMLPIEKQILMCDNDDELLMMACAMLQRTREIFDQVLGEDGRRKMFESVL